MIIKHKDRFFLNVDATTSSGKADVLSRVNQYGAVVFPHLNSNNLRQDFSDGLGSCLGKLIHHKHSDRDGAVEIKTDPDKPLYISATSGDTGMHTDNTFGTQKVGVMALGCDKAVENEGLSKMVYAVDIYRHVSEANPKDLPLLFEPDVLTVERDGEIASKPIFSVNRQGRLEISYRADDTAQIKIKPSAQAIFREIREFVENPKNQMVFGLKPGQILLVDNTAVLHGRSAFDPSKPRLLYRWWFDGNAPNVELGFTP